MSDLAFASACEQARLVRDREVSSRELVDLYLERIERLDGELGSYVTVLADQARSLADDKDQLTAGGGELPPLHGVPVAIKDLHFLADARTTLGTRGWAEFVAPFDEESVARLKAAGTVPLGKTNVPEFGTIAHTATQLLGPARNPWDTSHNAAGSSGGAGAALAAGLCPVAHGSDGGGSIRIPAAVNGVYGLKPSRDRVSNGPVIGDVWFGLTTTGALTRTVADAATMLDALAGYAPGDPGQAPPPTRPFAAEVGVDPGRLRIGVNLQAPFGQPIAPEVTAAVDDVRALLEDLGHGTEDVTFAVTDQVKDDFLTVWAATTGAQPFDASTYEPVNRWLVEVSGQRTSAEAAAAQFRLQLFARELVRSTAELDVLLTPTLLRLANRNDRYADASGQEVFEDQTAWVGVTPIVNVTGQPAANVPLVWDEASGLPVGVQLIGRPWDEVTLLRLSAQLEAARPWADRRPPGFG